MGIGTVAGVAREQGHLCLSCEVAEVAQRQGVTRGLYV